MGGGVRVEDTISTASYCGCSSSPTSRRPYPFEPQVRSRLRHHHESQALSCLLSGSLIRLTMPKSDYFLDLICHSLHRT